MDLGQLQRSYVSQGAFLMRTLGFPEPNENTVKAVGSRVGRYRLVDHMERYWIVSWGNTSLIDHIEYNRVSYNNVPVLLGSVATPTHILAKPKGGTIRDAQLHAIHAD